MLVKDLLRLLSSYDENLPIRVEVSPADGEVASYSFYNEFLTPKVRLSNLIKGGQFNSTHSYESEDEKAETEDVVVLDVSLFQSGEANWR